MKVIKQFIGGTTLVLVTIFFVSADILSRLVIAPLVHLYPGARVRILTWWVLVLRRQMFGLMQHAGRARLDIQPVIPSRGGVLVVMNHQSILDVPIVHACFPSGYPRMVAHVRYGKGVPLVSHMLSLYGHIMVQPGRTGRADLEKLAETARTSELPILIYPEGHRTRDGEIRPWKRGGLDVFLSARPWTVYVVVIDGLLHVARLPDFVRNITDVRCRVESVGPIEYDGRGRESHHEFVERLRRVMCDKLREMRADSGAGVAAQPTTKETAADAVKAT